MRNQRHQRKVQPLSKVKLSLDALEDRCLPSVAPLYYSYDGTNNNLTHPTWGSADTDLLRSAGTAYADGISAPAGPARPDARKISNVLATLNPDTPPNNRDMSNMIYAWGQFIDHDLDLTPSGNSEYIPITIPANDPIFTPGSSMPVFRTIYDSSTGTSTSNPRQQSNTVTSFLDGSMIYGSDATRSAALRSLVGGQLKTSTGDLLPFNIDNLSVGVDIPGTDPTSLFLAGDVRVNENSELTSLTVLFVREHNYWAGQLATQHPSWTDEQLYQGARQIVIAEIQCITYNEFLPALLGTSAMKPYQGYNSKVNPSVSAEFSAAAYRVGHSLVDQQIEFFNNNGSESHEPLDFNTSADNPAVLQGGPGWVGAGVDNILKYLITDNAQEVDSQMVNALRNQLFAVGDPSVGGLDLYAIDVQRGRDLGLPDYNTERAAFGLPKVTSFNQITSDPTVQSQLRSLYGTTTDAKGVVHDNVNSIDLFVGGLAENHVKGGSVGPLFTRIIADQFNRTRVGDRLWYQRIFSGSDLTRIQNTTLSDIIRRNTSLTNLQKNVFYFSPGTISGTVFKDVNKNGIQDVGETGLAGAIVMLYSTPFKLLATTTTAADGSYHFSNLAENTTYHVIVMSKNSSYQTPSTATSQTVQLLEQGQAGKYDLNFGMALRKLPGLSSLLFKL